MSKHPAKPYPPQLKWRLEIEGVTQGAFAEVSGLDSETEVIGKQRGPALRQAPQVGRQIAAQTQELTITFKRGYINNTELWAWRGAVMDGKIERKSGSVILCGDDGSEIMRYTFAQGYPSTVKDLIQKDQGKSATVQLIELVVTGVKRA